ncbi:hypothetical protein CEP45_01030 [Mergibacter septicus]|uniref:AI-2E family transporter n=1 Tax=Mergibacter septicus TaxID=221402 RepID=UPI001C76FD85|nr:AI-2E family transporter [Mergibacter septicus]QDJ12513.1 hypothetical protein CEP45_01030 [Mergibacter septicus]
MAINNSSPSTFRNSLIILACLVIIFAGIKAAAVIVVQLLLALFLAIICTPIVNFMLKYRIPLWLAVIFLFALIFIGLTFFAGLVGAAVNEFSNSIPLYKKLLVERITDLATLLQHWNIHLTLPKESLIKHFDPNIVMGVIRSLLSGLSGAIANIFVLVLIVVFMLFEAQSAKQKLKKILPPHQMNSLQRVLNSVISYLAVKTFVSFLTGFSVWLVLTLLDIQYAVLWGTVTFLLNYIPNIGSILAAVPVIIQVLLLNGVSEAVLILFAFIVINMIIGNFIEPRLMGKTLGLSTLMIFISLIFWGWLLGTTGMLLSVPLTVAVKVGLEANPKTRNYASFLGDNSDESVENR